MKTLAIGVAAAAIAIAAAVPANAAQAGFNDDGQCSGCKSAEAHTWLKIGRGELESNAMGACLQTGVGYFGCNYTVPLVESQHASNPRANGYWAERYYTVADPGATIKVRSGTW